MTSMYTSEISPPEAGNIRRYKLRHFLLGGKPDRQIWMGGRQCARCRNEKPPIQSTRKRRDCAFRLTCLKRGLTAISSSPNSGWAAPWIAPNWPVPPAPPGPRDGRHPAHSWRNLLEQLQPLYAQTIFKTDEACDVTTRPS